MRARPTTYELTVRKVLEMAQRGDTITAPAVAAAIHKDRTNVTVTLRAWAANRWLTRKTLHQMRVPGHPPYVYTITAAGWEELTKIRDSLPSRR